MRLYFQISAFLLVSFCVGCATPKTIQPEKPTEVVIDSTQIFTIYSPTTQQNYRIQLRVPGSYQTNLTKKYPIIIKVDGQWDFPLAASVFNNIYFDGQMPETIVIGIDWADFEGNVHAIRSRDLLPAPINAFNNSGHAKIFVDALANDIIPELNKRFRLNGQEFLLGGSWGGTFVTFALLDRPQVFDGAIAIGGDYEIGNEVFAQQIKELSGTDLLAGKSLYIGVGKQDLVAPNVAAYAGKLQQAKLKGFKLKFDNLDGFGHSGMNVPGYAIGYRHIFARPQLSLSANTLKQYVGTYKSIEENSVELIIQTGAKGLIAVINGNQFELFTESENSFYQEGSFFNIEFNGATAKVVTFYGETIFKQMQVQQ